MSISLVAGLGNPGRDYDQTRHNVGFVVVEALARQLGLAWQKQRSFEAEVARWDPEPGRTVYFAKPLTFMNESGRALQAMTGFYKIPGTAVTAVYDDLTINLGLVKVSVSGSAGGHNGVASLLERLGNGFIRYRIGIGPKDPPQMDLKDFVLGKFTPSQQLLLENNLERYVTGLRLVLDHGADKAMNQLNRRDSQ
ncbi:aminoacyl-tRNA hydrolase [Rariglobus hedericola]|uniref:Peptidyl-tRNA hydrolase n=1 Tax=Rariglobus hedericola TaxID=2597822 RepID=A0A556QLA8_9BACT|nr:aminoacyl-tRNA hydrolase [Rariglobus hedericola]TSJ77435.1 aminoacyl-tRNA hydrolase [Rariglobus hedericola]